jgi:hypothetical protein
MTDPGATVRIEEMIRERGAAYEQLLEHRRERERAHKRDARKGQQPEQ